MSAGYLRNASMASGMESNLDSSIVEEGIVALVEFGCLKPRAERVSRGGDGRRERAVVALNDGPGGEGNLAVVCSWRGRGGGSGTEFSARGPVSSTAPGIPSCKRRGKVL